MTYRLGPLMSEQQQIRHFPHARIKTYSIKADLIKIYLCMSLAARVHGCVDVY